MRYQFAPLLSGVLSGSIAALLAMDQGSNPRHVLLAFAIMLLKDIQTAYHISPIIKNGAEQ